MHMTDEQTERLQMRVSPEFIKSVDNWRRKQEDLPSRSEAIRRLVEQALKAKGK
jgi:metal-responsive CopG/Arc/MetJ family transcriptional regulator